MIDVNFDNLKSPFSKITNKSNQYIKNCFDVALNLLKKDPSNFFNQWAYIEKIFLKNKFLGITEYLAKKVNKRNKVAMLIYNKRLSVSPITTHLPLKLVHKTYQNLK